MATAAIIKATVAVIVPVDEIEEPAFVGVAPPGEVVEGTAPTFLHLDVSKAGAEETRVTSAHWYRGLSPPL